MHTGGSQQRGQRHSCRARGRERAHARRARRRGRVGGVCAAEVLLGAKGADVGGRDAEAGVGVGEGGGHLSVGAGLDGVACERGRRSRVEARRGLNQEEAVLGFKPHGIASLPFISPGVGSYTCPSSGPGRASLAGGAHVLSEPTKALSESAPVIDYLPFGRSQITAQEQETEARTRARRGCARARVRALTGEQAALDGAGAGGIGGRHERLDGAEEGIALGLGKGSKWYVRGMRRGGMGQDGVDGMGLGW